MLAKINDNFNENSDNAILGYKFSAAELKAIQECNHESFVQRSLPLGLLCSGGAWYAVKTGYLQPSKKFGATPKALISGIIGYVIGKISYQGKCEEKFLQIPDSKIGQIIRERKQKSGVYYGGEFDPGQGGGFGSKPHSSSPNLPGSSQQRSDGFSDISPRTFTDLDTDHPISNLDDSYPMNGFSQAPSTDDSLPSIAPPPTHTYEELRRMNREEYEQSKMKQYSRPQKPPPAPSTSLDDLGIPSQEPSPKSNPSTPGTWNKQRNIYGDIWEK